MKKLLFLSTALPLWLTAGPAAAEPVTIALFGAAFAASTAGAIVSFGFSLAFTYGVSLLQKALMKPKGATPAGVEVDVKMGDDQPIRFCLGTFATAGVRKYMNTYGQVNKTPNAYLVDVIELSNVPIAGIDAVWVNDKKVTPQWNNPNADGFIPFDEYHGENGEDYLLMKIYDGMQTAADPFLVSTFGSDPERPWTSEMIGRGCAYAIMIARYDQDAWNGAPTFLFEPKPLALYDIRKDSTNGGSGTHRWGQPATYEPSDNPVVMIYNLIRGIYYGTEWIFGGQNLAAIRLPPSSWMAAANECDVLVAKAEGGTEKQYRAGIEVTGDMEPLDVIDEIRKACNGRIAEVGGVFKILVSAPGAAVYSFTDDDVVVTSEQSFDPFPTLDETINGIEGTYPEPEEKWATNDAPPRYSDDLEEEDGDRRLVTSVQFAAAPFSRQVQRLMAAMIKDQRRFRIHQFYLPPDAYRLEPNDVVAWTSVRNGYINKKFVVSDVTGEATFVQLVTLREIDPSDYDWSADEEIPTVITPTGPIVTTPQPTYGFSAVPWTILDTANNARRPTIKVITASGQDDVDRVWIQVRLKSSAEVIFDDSGIPYGVPYEWALNGTFLPSTLYQVRAKFIPYTNRQTLWADWVDVMTPAVFIGTVDVLDNAITAEKIANAAITAGKIMDEAITSLKLADQAVTTAKLEVGAVTQQILAAGSITLEKFIPGLEPIAVITGPTLPTTKTTSTIMFEDVLYTWNETSGAYESAQTGIPDGSITAQKLADAAVVASKLANGAVTHDKISAGSIYGDVIAARAITARELFLTDFENRVPNGNFEENTVALSNYWNAVSLGSISYVEKSVTPSLVKTGARSLSLNKAAGQPAANTNVVHKIPIPVTAGEVLTCETSIKGSGGTSAAGAYFRIHWIDAAFAQLAAPFAYSDVIDNGAIPADWVDYSVKVTVPAAAVYAQVQLINYTSNTTGASVVFDRLAIRKANAASLIVDGGIITNHLSTNAVTADKIAANAVIAGKIAAGAITTEKMAVGLGANYIENSDFLAGTTGWGTRFGTGSNWTISIRNDNFTPPGGAFQILQAPATTTDVYDVTSLDAGGAEKFYPVEAAKWYEFSCYYYGHRTTGMQLFIGWKNAAGAIISYSFTASLNANLNGDPASLLSNYQRAWLKAQAPAGTVSAQVFVRKLGGVAPLASGSYLWFTRLYFGQATENQIEATPWSPGGLTLIQGGHIVTGAVTASKIAALAVTAEKIAAGAIVADKIAAAAITGDKIAANTIGANHIAAQQITAKHIILTDYENLVPNGFFGQLSDEYYAKQGDYNAIGLIQGGFGLTGNNTLLLQKKSGNMGASINVEWHNQYIFPVSMAEHLYCETVIYGNVGTSPAGFYFRIYFYDSNKNVLAGGHGTQYYDIAGNAPVPATWTKYAANVPVPTGACFAKIQFISHSTNTTAQNILIDRAVVRRAKGAELIVDGTVTANKLNVNSLTAISANFGNATVTGYIQSANGKMQLDFNNGTIIINS